MAVLSEWDIIRYLGNGIDIYPFNGINSSLSGCSLNLTASEFAFVIDEDKDKEGENKDQESKDKEGILTRKKATRQKIIEESTKYFNIPARQTVLIWTQESISLDGRFCGSIHSKVSMAARGIGHISTRVNPYWEGGVLSLALHNLSDQELRVSVGETIAYLRFYKLTSESSRLHGDADSLQSALAKVDDAFAGCYVDEEEKSKLKQWIKGEEPRKKLRNGNKQALTKALEEDRKERNDELNEYEKAKRDLKIEKNPFLFWLRWFEYRRVSWGKFLLPIFTLILGWILRGLDPQKVIDSFSNWIYILPL